MCCFHTILPSECEAKPASLLILPRVVFDQSHRKPIYKTTRSPAIAPSSENPLGFLLDRKIASSDFALAQWPISTSEIKNGQFLVIFFFLPTEADQGEFTRQTEAGTTSLPRSKMIIKMIKFGLKSSLKNSRPNLAKTTRSPALAPSTKCAVRRTGWPQNRLKRFCAGAKAEALKTPDTCSFWLIFN